MSTEELPQLEVLHRVMEIPVVERAVHASASTYGWLKDSNPLLYWALSSAEATLSIAGRQAAPLARKFEGPITVLDFTLCRGLDEIEKKLPFVKEKPEEVLVNAYSKARDTVSGPYDFISDHLKQYLSMILNISRHSANVLLNTEFGAACIKNIENSADFLDMIIEIYIPQTDSEDVSAEKPASEHRLVQLLHTLMRLSRKVSRRAAAETQRRLQSLEPNSYACRLVEQLTLLGIPCTLETLQRAMPWTLDVARIARICPPPLGGPEPVTALPVAAH